jgi:hypothetical protein
LKRKGANGVPKLSRTRENCPSEEEHLVSRSSRENPCSSPLPSEGVGVA